MRLFFNGMSVTLFPAYAGVIPSDTSSLVGDGTFPRIRGGDPNTPEGYLCEYLLFPAYAGVILLHPSLGAIEFPFPRIRGGDPMLDLSSYTKADFSPHTRG